MAWIGALVTAGVAYYNNQQQKKAQKNATKSQDALIQEQMRMSKFLEPYGRRALDDSEDLYSQTIKRNLRLANGTRSDILTELNPEIEAANRGDQEAMRTAGELSQRGGGRSLFRATSPWRRQDAVQRLVGGARTNATANIGQLAQARGATGAGLLGATFGGLQGAASSASALGQQKLAWAQQGQANGEEFGSAMADLMKWYQQRQAAKPK